MRWTFQSSFYESIYFNQRGGSDPHLIMIRRRADIYRKIGFFCFIDTGEDPGRELPDLLVFPYLEVETPTGRSMDPRLWDTPHRLAVEVEAEPEKHPDRVYGNWRKNLKMGLPTVFVVDNEERQRVIKDLLEGKGVRVVANVLKNYFAGNVQVDVQPINFEELRAVDKPQAAQPSTKQEIPVTKPPIKPTAEKLTLRKPSAAIADSSTLESALDRLRRYQQEGWGFKVKKRGKRRYLYARRSEGGRRIEKFIGTIENELKEALAKVKPGLVDADQL